MIQMQRQLAEAGARQRKADEIATEFERWSYGEGYQAGRVDGGRDGFAEGYGAGFDAGSEVGAGRMLAWLESHLGREVLDALIADGMDDLPNLDEANSYLSRTAYLHQPEKFSDWRGTARGDTFEDWQNRLRLQAVGSATRSESRGIENGAQLPAWDAADDDSAGL